MHDLWNQCSPPWTTLMYSPGPSWANNSVFLPSELCVTFQACGSGSEISYPCTLSKSRGIGCVIGPRDLLSLIGPNCESFDLSESSCATWEVNNLIYVFFIFFFFGHCLQYIFMLLTLEVIKQDGTLINWGYWHNKAQPWAKNNHTIIARSLLTVGELKAFSQDKNPHDKCTEYVWKKKDFEKYSGCLSVFFFLFFFSWPQVLHDKVHPCCQVSG